jgi:hypothetical protein
MFWFPVLRSWKWNLSAWTGYDVAGVCEMKFTVCKVAFLETPSSSPLLHLQHDFIKHGMSGSIITITATH